MPSTPRIKIKRHFARLSEKRTDEVIGSLADLVIDFIKRSGGAKILKQQGSQETSPSPARGEDDATD